MQFSIHQFSSGIQNPTKNQKSEWVSGGFGGEIANESHPVPEEIKQAVNTAKLGGWRGFGIPDAYAPKLGEIALIARNLGTYCVLAVANLQNDEGNRPFIAYRYFWLDKTQFKNYPNRRDVDGIGTLLWYWQQKEQPQYNIGELQNNRSSYTTSWNNLQLAWLFEHWQQQYYQRIQSLFSDIHPSHQPLIYKATEICSQLTYEEVHCLAIRYCIVNNCHINWAWNVRRLENPTNLNVIYCADTEAFKWFNSKFPSPIILSTPIPTPTPSLQERITTDPTSLAGETGNEWQIKKCLGRFRGTFTEQDVLNLMDFYQQYRNGIGNFADETEINKFINGSNPQNFAIQYATLITALAPSQNQDILTKLMDLKEQKKRVAINFLGDLKTKDDQNESCRNHPFYMYFYGAISLLQDYLSESLEQKGSNFSPSNILKQITQFRPPFSAWIFFFLLLSGLIYWQTSNILSRLPWVPYTISTKNQETNPSPSDTNAVTPQTNLVFLLNMYEKTFDAVKIGKDSAINLEGSESFQSISTAIQKSKEEILKILNENQQLLTDLKSQDPKVIQEARKPEKYPIYNDLKQFTTLKSANLDTLPSLSKDSSDNDKASVTMLQKALKRGGNYYSAGQEEDQQGVFGEATENAVKNAQTQARLPSDQRSGIVGQITWDKILKDRLQDLQVEAVYQRLKTNLSQDNTNIVTVIKKCQYKHNQEETPLHFNECLENIETPTTPSSEGADSGENTQTTSD